MPFNHQPRLNLSHLDSRSDVASVQLLDGITSSSSPISAMNFLELAEKYQLVTFLNLVRVAGLEEAFGDFGDYTIFAPDENAFLCKHAVEKSCT